jgi:hypothetical protein
MYSGNMYPGASKSHAFSFTHIVNHLILEAFHQRPEKDRVELPGSRKILLAFEVSYHWNLVPQARDSPLPLRWSKGLPVVFDT